MWSGSRSDAAAPGAVCRPRVAPRPRPRHPEPAPPRREEPIVTLSEISADLTARPATLGTLAVEHDVPFEVVGPAWAFAPDDARRLKALWHAHVEKRLARGLRCRGVVLVASAPAT
jgi:hypothetical protein